MRKEKRKSELRKHSLKQLAQITNNNFSNFYLLIYNL